MPASAGWRRWPIPNGWRRRCTTPRWSIVRCCAATATRSKAARPRRTPTCCALRSSCANWPSSWPPAAAGVTRCSAGWRWTRARRPARSGCWRACAGRRSWWRGARWRRSAMPTWTPTGSSACARRWMPSGRRWKNAARAARSAPGTATASWTISSPRPGARCRSTPRTTGWRWRWPPETGAPRAACWRRSWRSCANRSWPTTSARPTRPTPPPPRLSAATLLRRCTTTSAN